MQEQKRPILSIKRKPSLMYQKPSQKPDSEQNAAQPEQLADSDSTGTRKKPNYREPPGWEEVRGKFSDGYFNLGKMLTEIQLMQKKRNHGGTTNHDSTNSSLWAAGGRPTDKDHQQGD